MMRLLLSFLLLLLFLQMNAQTYPKVILPGDYPDPSIMQNGKDYYMTWHSPFYYAPRILNLALAGFNELGAVMSCHASIWGKGSAIMLPDLLKIQGGGFTCLLHLYLIFPVPD